MFPRNGAALWQEREYYTHRRIVSRDDSTEYKQSYLICSTGMGTKSKFAVAQPLYNSCPLEEAVNFEEDEWQERDDIDYTQIYFHSIFYSEKLRNKYADFPNCRDYLELVFDSWDDSIWACTDSSPPPDPVQRYLSGGRAINGHVSDPSSYYPEWWRGITANYSAAWLHTGQNTEGEKTLLYECVTTANKLTMDFHTGEITAIDNEGLNFDLRLWIKDEGVVTDYAAEIVQAINDEREIAGVPKVTVENNTTTACKRHGQDLAQNQAIENGLDLHEGSDGTTPRQRGFEEGYHIRMVYVR